jgi:hypothetical protein
MASSRDRTDRRSVLKSAAVGAAACILGDAGGADPARANAAGSEPSPARAESAGADPPAAPPTREVVPGISTSRIIPGAPMDLAGRRIVFTDWSFIQPGDVDWVNAQGKSVAVRGSDDPLSARHVGRSAPRGIRIAARKPQVVGPIQRPHRCVIQDGGLYRAWTGNEYFESGDAMTWTRKAKLALERAEDGIGLVFLDPGAPEGERFKSVWATDAISASEFDAYRARFPGDWEPRALTHYEETKRVSGIRGSVSPDGVAWKTLPLPLTVEYSDTYVTAYFDPALRRYVLYTRFWSIRPYTAGLPVDMRHSWTRAGRRAIGRSESDDFRHFSPSRMLLEAPPSMLPSETLYTNCRTTIPGAPDHHLMFPAVWNASISDTTRIALASSRDGETWNWVPEGDLLETGEFGQWNGGCIWVTPNLIELPNGDWALPYDGHSVPHKYPRGKRKVGLGWAVWPKGRLVGLDAPDRGEFTLMPVMAPGSSLKINAGTKRAGRIRVEVAGDPSRTLAKCAPLFGDLHWTTVRWDGADGLGVRRNQPVTLRFDLDQASIYGLQFD